MTAKCEFSFSYTKSVEEAYEKAGAALQKYTRERNGATVVVAQTPMDSTALRRHVPTLKDFCVVTMPSVRGWVFVWLHRCSAIAHARPHAHPPTHTHPRRHTRAHAPTHTHTHTGWAGSTRDTRPPSGS